MSLRLQATELKTPQTQVATRAEASPMMGMGMGIAGADDPGIQDIESS
jgi:hypothetical protein